MNNITSLPKGFVLYSERYQYTIIKVIGRGANGYVYLATLFSPKRNASCQVALKEWASLDCCQRLGDMSIQYPKNLKSEILYRNFMDEYTVLSKFNHPNVVRVYDCMCTNGTYYYSMEYLPEGTLADYISRQSTIIDEGYAKYIIRKIASGLEAFHQKGYVHGDLKLNNIVMRNKDSLFLIDGGIKRLYGGEQNSILADIYALANIFLYLLSGTSEIKPNYEKTEHLFVIAKEKGHMNYYTENAIRHAFSGDFKCVHDFMEAILHGYFPPYIYDKKFIHRNYSGNNVVENDTEKAKVFLEGMEKMSDFFISKEPVDIATIEKLFMDRYLMTGLKKIDNWFKEVQNGFVLGLRLPSPKEFLQFIGSQKIEAGIYLTYDRQKMKFFSISVPKKLFPWQKQDVKVEEDHGLKGCYPQSTKFYYACDLSPLIADSHKIHPFSQSTQLVYDAILPVSLFGFCKVSNGGKWGMVDNMDWVSMEIKCIYDGIEDISITCIPGPGMSPTFLGTLAYIGDQIDVYELVEGEHLRLVASMTQAEWNRRSRYS